MAYLYRHIRSDKNEPFYIGVGGLEEFDSYKRAYSHSARSNFWINISKKTSFEVEIILDDLSIEEAFVKEIEFIKLYGRKNLRTGPLVNLTDGGEGSPGVIHSKETRDKMSKSRKGLPIHENTRNALKLLSLIRKGKPRPEYIVAKMRNSTKNRYKGEENGFYGKKQSKKVLEIHSKLVINLETGIYYDCAKDACKSTNIGYSYFRAMLNGRSKNKTPFIYISERIYD